jgi:SAM-dependent methyltransferase
MTSPRLDPPFWRHDGYTLGLLADAVRRVVAERHERLAAGALVVDLGAGDAPYRSLFTAGDARYLACDIDGGDVTIVPGAPLALADAVAQLVVSFQVLEHVWDLDWYLGEARRLLAPGGELVLSTHGTWPYHPHPTDFRRWTRDGLVKELESRGFEIRSVDALVGPLAWTTQFRALGFHGVLAKIPLVGGVLSAIVSTVMNLRMRLEDALTPTDWRETNAAVYLIVARPSAVAPASGSRPA